MFGALVDDEGPGGWGSARLGRFAGRSFSDTDWAALAAASANLTAAGISAVVNATRGNTYQQNTNTQYQCQQGYVYNPATKYCEPLQQASQQGGSFFSNVDPMLLAVGAGALVLLLTRR